MKHLRRYVARTVCVNTRTGDVFTGTLAAANAEGLAIENVSVVEPNKAELGGTVFVPTVAVAWVQVI